ncbi:MAG: hypothetical protein GXP50_08500 [Deltaproteobacteria bacterium]|nr:hypothetical protein [Deltaproteobacteria bacterium]
MGVRRFGPGEIAAVQGAVPLAQELTGQHYGLPDDWFRRTSHEICTGRDLRPFEVLGPGVLAHIRRVHRLEDAPWRPCRRLCPHYRICLQDHNLLARLREERGIRLADLLVTVLIHEYVHLVRFCRYECPYRPLRQDTSRQEEDEVNRVTRRILRAGPASLREAGERLLPAG